MAAGRKDFLLSTDEVSVFSSPQVAEIWWTKLWRVETELMGEWTNGTELVGVQVGGRRRG